MRRRRGSNNRISSAISGAFGGAGLTPDDLAKQRQDSRMAGMAEEEANMRIQEHRRQSDPETIARREELQRVTEENALSAASQAKEVNDNYGEISNSLKGIDVNVELSASAVTSNGEEFVEGDYNVAEEVMEVRFDEIDVMRFSDGSSFVVTEVLEEEGFYTASQL